jgi:hypothetical protein
MRCYWWLKVYTQLNNIIISNSAIHNSLEQRLILQFSDGKILICSPSFVKNVFYIFHMLLSLNGKNLFCSVTEFSSISLLYNTFMPIDCHGLCNSAGSSSDWYRICLNTRKNTPTNKMSVKKYFSINYIHIRKIKKTEK